MNVTRVKTTWGELRLTLQNDTVISCTLPPLSKTPSNPFKIDRFETLEKMIAHFPSIETPEGTEFQQAVWKQMRQISKGKTQTYSDIAMAIGRPKAVRAVGSACGANPIPLWIPCHRVVAQNGLGGFGAGLPWKKHLLALEGGMKMRWTTPS